MCHSAHLKLHSRSHLHALFCPGRRACAAGEAMRAHAIRFSFEQPKNHILGCLKHFVESERKTPQNICDVRPSETRMWPGERNPEQIRNPGPQKRDRAALSCLPLTPPCVNEPWLLVRPALGCAQLCPSAQCLNSPGCCYRLCQCVESGLWPGKSYFKFSFVVINLFSLHQLHLGSAPIFTLSTEREGEKESEGDNSRCNASARPVGAPLFLPSSDLKQQKKHS